MRAARWSDGSRRTVAKWRANPAELSEGTLIEGVAQQDDARREQPGSQSGEGAEHHDDRPGHQIHRAPLPVTQTPA